MKYGWSYMEALTHALEAWSGDIARHDPRAFLYHGANFRYAIERSLFFRLVNDVGLQERFDALVEDAPLPSVPADTWCVAIAPYLCANRATPSTIMPSIPAPFWKRRLRSQIGNILRIGQPCYRTTRLQDNADVFFLVIHPKFVTFLSPIAHAVGSGAAFLTVDDPIVEAHIAKQKMSCVAVRSAHSRSLPSRGLLSHFRDLCGVFDRMGTMLDALKPRIIVVPEGNAPIYEIANIAGQQRGIATICIQHGAPAYTNPGFRNWHFDDVLVWGDAFIEPFASHNPGQHFTVAGTPAQLPCSVDAGSEPIGSIGFFLQKGAIVIPASEWKALLEFIGWAAREFSNLKIIVRDHPSQPHLAPAERKHLEGLANIAFMPPPRFSLNEALAACDVVVASASTTLLEAVQSGAIPFIFGTGYPKDFPNIAAAEAAVSAPDLSIAKVLLARLAEDGAWRAALHDAGKRLRPHLFAATGDKGAARIANLLRAACG